ncbi:MAG TPA: tetratricopeptide repeat protein [candidate division WOR-3 bacterium]|uniref:Tetratricopeptide repeat protein n=2 Tax=candidate division WOR-3 bacterium TaxID=2052148 RepID=A0A9C9JZM4_UNCW3|nr:tetratricopeptide repeat protein [candidate division WOR-3 bacterium]
MRENRLATILYADLTGFTKLTATLGPEKITELVNECFKIIDKIIHVHDGTILRHEGDRVMAVFGFPKSQGYDAYSAILSALRIKEAVRGLSYPIEVHIGVASGEIICDEDKIYGYVTEAASYLEETAPAGEIYIDLNCYELTKTFFDFERLSKNEKVFFRVLAEKKQQALYTNKFFNRKEEIESLSNYILKKKKVIIVTGNQGIGKTRFIHETFNRLNREEKKFNLFQTSFLTARSLQFYESILKIIMELKPDFGIKEKIALVTEESYKTNLFNQFCEIIFAAGKIKPLVLLFQYFERIDKNSFDFIKFLINNINEYDVYTIFEMHNLHNKLVDELKSATGVTPMVLELTPLDKETQFKIVKDLCDDVKLEKELLDEICRHAGGNPLFTTEICRYVKNQQDSVKLRERIKIPYRVKEVFNHLIDHIPVGIFNTLSLGAVYGYTIEKEFLKTAAPNYEETVDYGVRNDLLNSNDGELSFKNPFLREEICSRLPKSVRKTLHRKIASILRERFSTYDNDKKLAYHFKESGDYELALHYVLKWARRLKDIHANEMALEAYNEALQLCRQTNIKAEYRILKEQVDLLDLLGMCEEERSAIERLESLMAKDANDTEKLELALLKGRYLMKTSQYKKAIKLYEELRKKSDDIRVIQNLGVAYYNQSNFKAALNSLQQALKSAQKSKDIRKEAEIRGNFSLVYTKMGEKEKSLEYCNQALKLYDKLGDTVARARIIANMGSAYYYLNRFNDSLAAYQEALKVAEDIGDIMFQAKVLTNIGSLYQLLGDYDKSIKNCEKALKIVKSVMNKKWESIILNNIGNNFATVGKFEQALSFFEQALEISKEVGDKTGIVIRYGNIGDSYAHLGKPQKALEYIQKSHGLSIELNIIDWISFYKNELANAMVLNNRLEEALQLAKDAVAIARKAKNISYEINALSTQAFIYFKTGELKKAFKLSRNAVNALEKKKIIEGVVSIIYYNHYKILKSLNKDKEAYLYLEKAYNDIKERGDRISNENLRKSFFMNRKENREIKEEWEALRNQR